MFAPLKTWRRWHRKINKNQKRHALATAIAASGCTALNFARGHNVENVPEVPFVIDSLNIETTKNLLGVLNSFGLEEELNKIRNNKKLRPGKGKMRNSRYILKKGPLIVYGDENNLVKRAAKNLPGVETCHVQRMNLL